MRLLHRLVLTAAVAALLPACRTAAPRAGAAYAGSKACASCHADAYKRWETSPHHLAMLPANDDAPLRALARTTGRDYDPMVVRDGALTMKGSALGYAGDVPLAFALGHEHVEQFIGPITPGRLQALPLALDVPRDAWFDLFAGETRTPEDWGHWTNRGMNANAQCIFCHTTGYDKGYDLARDTYDSTWHEMGVGCEACHGPGAQHVQMRQDRRGVDPYAGRDPETLLAACGACHSRRVTRAPWTPGEPFLDAFEPELLDTDSYYADGQVKEELYELTSFGMSRMHAEGVRCWNCHDPHDRGTNKPGNELCRTCHTSDHDSEAHTHHTAGSAGARCTACHMPTTVYMVHDPRHDHSFARPDPELTRSLGIPNACNRCHTERDAAWAADQVRAWFPNDAVRAKRRAVATAIHQGRQGDGDAVPALLELLAGDADAVRRASAGRLLARFPTSAGVTPALLHALVDREPLPRAAAAWAFAQRTSLSPEVRSGLEDALRDPVRIVRQHAALALRSLDPATLPAATAQALASATAEWRESQEIESDTPEAHYNLAIFAAGRGDLPEAEHEYREALRLWPRSIQARHNLALLLAQSGRLDEAARELETLVAGDPVPASTFALGLLYGQQGRWPEAADALARCLEENPTYPRARYNRALALAKAGETTQALDELERAADDPPSRREAILTLVDLARQVNDRPRLERWVVEAAKLDPAVMENPELQGLLQP